MDRQELEARLAAVEAKLAHYEEMLAAFAAGPGRKLAVMLGIKVPEELKR